MSKVIIKPIINLPNNGLNDLYKLINDQYKQSDIVIVPYYCEVYVVDGNPEVKVEDVKEVCETCKYEKYDKAFMKCVACDVYSNWEAKKEEKNDG